MTQALKRIYLAGPMSGLPDFNYPAFHAAAAVLRAQGHYVENPAENPASTCGTWQGYMRMSLCQIAVCDCLYMLPGWRSSRGARIEHGLALDLDLEVVDFAEATC